MLILPGNPLFNETLACIPPNWREKQSQCVGNVSFVAEPNSGLLRPVTPQELKDYVYGGEYEERLTELDDHDVG